MPLLWIDSAGKSHQLGQEELGDAFPPEVILLLKEVRLHDLNPVPDQGAFIGLGAVWLAPSRPGGRPRIVTINVQALAEAKAAAKHDARRAD